MKREATSQSTHLFISKNISSNSCLENFPEDSIRRGDNFIMTVTNKYPANDLICYSPQWAAQKQEGQPKKDAKQSPEVMDLVAKNKRREMM